MAQGSFNPKNRFLGQKVCSVARGRMDTQTHTKLNTEDTLSGFSTCSFDLSSRIGPIDRQIDRQAGWAIHYSSRLC